MTKLRQIRNCSLFFLFFPVDTQNVDMFFINRTCTVLSITNKTEYHSDYSNSTYKNNLIRKLKENHEYDNIDFKLKVLLIEIS